MNPRRFAAVALIAGLSVAAGCGGSKTKSTASSISEAQSPATQVASTETQPKPVPANATFVARADAVCRGANAIRERIRTSNESPDSKFFETAASQQKEYEQLAKLVSPSSIASDWKRVIADEKTLSDSAKTIALYAQANRLHRAERLFAVVGHAEHDMVPILTRAGFNNCTHFH